MLYVGLTLFLCICILAFIGLTSGKSEADLKVSQVDEKLKAYLTKTEGGRAYFVCYELKKMYYIELDAYDETYTEVEEEYELDYTMRGWGYSTITHNGKEYNLHEV